MAACRIGEETGRKDPAPEAMLRTAIDILSIGGKFSILLGHGLK